MPTYGYECQACGHAFEEFQSITAKPLATCPSCARPKLQRLIGPGGGFLFKGSGFYSTDYRSASYQSGAAAARSAESGGCAGPGAASCAKPGCPKNDG